MSVGPTSMASHTHEKTDEPSIFQAVLESCDKPIVPNGKNFSFYTRTLLNMGDIQDGNGREFNTYPGCVRNCGKIAHYIHAYLVLCCPDTNIPVHFKSTILTHFADLPFRMNAWVEAYRMLAAWLNKYLTHSTQSWTAPIFNFWNDHTVADSFSKLADESKKYHLTPILSTIPPVQSQQEREDIKRLVTEEEFQRWLSCVMHEVKFNGCVKVHEMLKNVPKDWFIRKVPLLLDTPVYESASESFKIPVYIELLLIAAREGHREVFTIILGMMDVREITLSISDIVMCWNAAATWRYNYKYDPCSGVYKYCRNAVITEMEYQFRTIVSQPIPVTEAVKKAYSLFCKIPLDETHYPELAVDSATSSELPVLWLQWLLPAMDDKFKLGGRSVVQVCPRPWRYTGGTEKFGGV